MHFRRFLFWKKKAFVSMKKQNHLLIRYFILLLGLAVMAVGVVFSIKADLGTSPISSLPYVAGLISGLSVGMATILMHLAFVGIQILLLRKRYEPIQLFQLLVGVIFGFMIDGADSLLSGVSYHSYGEQWVFCFIGILCVAVGVTLEIISNVVILAGEGVVRSVAEVSPFAFGNIKVAFDVTLVVLSVILGIAFLYQPAGVGAGTIAAALLVGILAKLFLKPLQGLREKLDAKS